MILASLPDTGLNDLAESIVIKYHVECIPYEIDLIDEYALINFHKWVSHNFSVFMLINNAGKGGSIAFEEASFDYINDMVLLNVRSTARLVRSFIPNLKEHDKSYILNVSSLAAFNPMPYKTVYSATKAFVYYLSRGLSVELKEAGINVSVLNPGAIPTNAEVCNRIEKIGFFGRLSVVEASKVAELSLNGLIKGKSVIIPGWLNKLSFVLMKIVPTSYHLKITARVFKKEFKEKNKQHRQIEKSHV
jgi:short-subunit dehydrogenase